MANYKRRRPRTTSTHGRWNKRRTNFSWLWMNSWPRWHDVVFHTRPRRRRTREALIFVMQGRDPEAIAWPLSKKPHHYYW